MSDSQFAYGGLTLDELRSLAASPQVGTMQAMPQSFRALADHVGEVADLLTHAQADLPNWWKGPAAEQAAATLGRAAAEAREFHESAIGAATAVGRCAQVVAEQQNQMMNVPEVPEPGITAVVQRPATPLEALEAARQSASYQAAHEQAVQVVNGIAAQYLETRGELATVTITRGKNFDTSKPIPGATQIDATPSQSHSRDEEYGGSTHSQAGSTRVDSTGFHLTDTDDPARKQEVIESERERHTSTGPKQQVFESPASALPFKANTPSRRLGHTAQETEEVTRPSLSSGEIDSAVNKVENTSNPLNYRDMSPASTPAQQSADLDSPNSTRGDVESALYNEQLSSLDERFLRSKSTSDRSKATPGNRHSDRVSVDREKSPRGPARTERLPSSYSNNGPDPAPRETAQLHPEDSNITNAAAIPPYVGIGSTGRSGLERNPRPAYLKERKSTWLPDTVAAPPDGVIGPDCSLHP